MKHMCITDMTIRQAGKAAGYTLSFREKIELAKLLDRLGVSAIELHAIENPKIDSLLIKSVASAVKTSAVSVPVALTQQSVETVWNALKEAKHPRIQVPAPVSAVQMEYLAGKKPAAMLEAISQTVAAAKAVCEDVEFLADDATRADPAFLYEALSAAIAAGATGVTVCDAAGSLLPDAFGSPHKAAGRVRQLCAGHLRERAAGKKHPLRRRLFGCFVDGGRVRGERDRGRRG